MAACGIGCSAQWLQNPAKGRVFMTNSKLNNADLANQAPHELVNTKARIDSNIRLVCFSAKELEEVVLSCNVPMIKLRWTVTDRTDGKVKADGNYEFESDGVTEFALRDVIKLAELAKFERSEPPFCMFEMTVNTANGQELANYNTIAGSLLSTKPATEVPSTDLIERLNAIPIANENMSEDELRGICIDFMKLQTSFPYKLSEDLEQYIVSQKKKRKLKAGMVHAGLPYITRGAGSLYRVAEVYDSTTGTIDASKDIVKNDILFGNACSGGATTSWARVVSSVEGACTREMTEASGYLPVGPYKQTKSVKEFVRAKDDPEYYTCKSICLENGAETMYESYACLKPADGVVRDGHMRMNTAYPTVVRKPDGSIDGEKSYTLMTEQVCYAINPNHIRILPDGTHYVAQGFVDMKYTFAGLFETNYIPFTFAEFTGAKKVEKGYARLEPEASDGSGLTEAVLHTNYPISDVFTSVRGENGEELFSYVFRIADIEDFTKTLKLSDILPLDEILKYRGNTFEITCQLFNGEKLTAFSAKL